MAEHNCPTCGCDVVGCTETTGGDGRRRWTQPISERDGGLTGGLVHVEGGRRCLMDVPQVEELVGG